MIRRHEENHPLSWARTDGNIRVSPGDEGDLAALARDYKKRPLHPLIALADGTMIDGSRRVIGLRMIGETEAVFTIVEERLSKGQIAALQLASAIHREGLSGYEDYFGCQQVLAENPGMQHQDLAADLNVHPSWVTHTMAADKCIPAVLEAYRDGKLTKSDVYALSKQTADIQAGALALKLSGAIRSRGALEAHARKARNDQPEAVRLQRVKVPLCGGGSLVLCGRTLGMAEVVELLDAVLKDAKKAAQTYDVATWVRMCADRVKGG